MKPLKLLLIAFFIVVLTGCTQTTNKEFIFSGVYEPLPFSEEIVVQDIPENFKTYLIDNYIEDFEISNGYYILSYIKQIDGVDTKLISVFNDQFVMLWEKEIESSYGIPIIKSFDDGFVISLTDNDSFTDLYQIYSFSGELIEEIYALNNAVINNDAIYFIEDYDDQSLSHILRFDSIEKEIIHTVSGTNPNLRFLEDNIMVISMSENKQIELFIGNSQGELLYEKTYTNDEDIYTIRNGFLVDDGENRLIEVHDHTGDLVWTVKNLKGDISGLKIKEGNLTLKEGDKIITISPTGKLLSREEIELEIYQGNTPGTDQSDTTEYYQSHELVDYYKINEDLELYEVKFDHEFQLSGLNSVYLVKKDTILLNLGGLNSLVSVKYYNDTSIYLYERGLMLQYTPNINKIHQVDYDGNIIKSSLIICDSYNNETGHRLILDGNNIVKLYLP